MPRPLSLNEFALINAAHKTFVSNTAGFLDSFSILPHKEVYATVVGSIFFENCSAEFYNYAYSVVRIMMKSDPTLDNVDLYIASYKIVALMLDSYKK